MDILLSFDAKEEETLYQSSDIGARKGIPVQYIREQTEEMGAGKIFASDRETSQNLVSESPNEGQETKATIHRGPNWNVNATWPRLKFLGHQLQILGPLLSPKIARPSFFFFFTLNSFFILLIDFFHL